MRRLIKSATRLVFSMVTLAWVAILLGGTAHAQPSPSPGVPVSSDKLEQLVAPIALYPDSLLSQVLMASCYPLEIVEADRWATAHPGLKGQALQDALATQTWDPSVSSLTAFPDVLHRMSMNLDWTQDLGEAFLAQQKDVMDAVQRMRARARDAGNLNSGPQQTVAVQKEAIVIAPVSPEVVYVPAYDPTIVYGAAWVSPTWYYPAVMAPPPGYAVGRALWFGAGVAVGAAMFGSCNWWNHNVYINNNFYRWPGYRGSAAYNNVHVNNINVNNRQTWQYNSYHRRDVNFNNTNLRTQYPTRPAVPGSTSAHARGYEPPTSRPTGTPTARSTGTPTSRPQSWNPSPDRQSAFSSSGNRDAEFRASQRGAESTGRARSSFSTSTFSGGRSLSFPRGGGGFRRR